MIASFLDSRFQPPAIQIISPERQTQWIQFDFSRRARIILQGKVNGHQANLLLDSGMEASALDRRLLSQLRLTSKGSVSLSDRSSQTEVPVATGLEIEIAQLRIQGLAAMGIDLDPLRAMTGAEIDGILGREVFEQLIVDIDFTRQRLLFAAPEVYTPPPAAQPTPLLRFSAGRGRTIAVTFEDRGPIELEFDLGSAHMFLLERRYWEGEHLLERRKVTDTVIGGANGLRRARLIRLASVEVAGIRLRDPEAVIADTSAEDSPRLGNGTIGMPILSRFRLATDYGRSVMYLTPQYELLDEPLPCNRSGLRVSHEGDRLRVLLVAKGSPAEQAGWRSAELISAINGRQVGEDYWTSGLSRWSEVDPGTAVSLTMADGSSRKLVLADYY